MMSLSEHIVSITTGAEEYCKCTEGQSIILERNIQNRGRLGEGNAKAANRRERKGGAPEWIKRRAWKMSEMLLGGAVHSAELTVCGQHSV